MEHLYDAAQIIATPGSMSEGESPKARDHPIPRAFFIRATTSA